MQKTPLYSESTQGVSELDDIMLSKGSYKKKSDSVTQMILSSPHLIFRLKKGCVVNELKSILISYITETIKNEQCLACKESSFYLKQAGYACITQLD